MSYKLLEQKKTFGKGIKSYMFVIFNDCIFWGGKSGVLREYTPRGAFRLAGMAVERVTDDEKNFVKHALKISHPYIGELILCADDDKKRDKFMTAVQEALSAFQKASGLANAFGNAVSDADFETAMCKKKLKHEHKKLSTTVSPSIPAPAPVSVQAPVINNFPWEKKI